MNKTTLEKMKQLKFYGMHDAMAVTLQSGNSEHFTAGELIAHLINAEFDDCYNRKINRCIKNARFRYQAGLEKIIYDPERNLDRNMVMRLAECTFIERGENLLITGSAGVGKSYLASALGHHACNQGYRVYYSNINKLLTKLKMAKATGTYIKEMRRIENQHLVVIDDFGLQPMDTASRSILMDMIEDRHGKASMVITSQFPVDTWHDVIGESTMADAILDRVVHNAHRIELEGESLRKKKREINNEKNQLNLNHDNGQ